MASGERRLGTSRRGMTVLGKIPTPSVPKPINLPSQRSENRGLDSNVEIVPRGTFSWGNAGIHNAAGVSKAGASGIISSPPTAWNGGIKNLTSGNNVGSLSKSNQPSSSGNGTRPLSAPPIATTTAWGSSVKTQAHVQVQSSGFTVVPMESVAPGSKESLPQHNEILFNRPTPSDGTVRDLELHPHPGVSANAGADPGHVPCPEGLQNPGDDHRSFARQGMPPAGTELPVGVAPYSDSLPHEVCFRSIGIPRYSSPHNRDMVLVRMVNNPSLYESYQPPVACFGQSGVYGSYRPQTRNVEQFATSGNQAAAGRSGTTDMRVGLLTSGNKFERGGFCDSGQDLHKYRDGQLGTVPRDRGHFGLHRDVDTHCDMSTQGIEWNHPIPGSFRSHNHFNEAVDFVKQEVASFVKQVPEKKIILLTKTPRVEAGKIDNSANNSTLLLDCNQRTDSCGQELGLSKFEVKNQQNSDEIFESKKVGGCEVRGSTKEITNLSIADQDTHCVKEDLSKVETGIIKLSSAGIPSSTLTLTTSNEIVKKEESKFQSKHDGKADAEGHRGKFVRKTRKIAIQGGLEPVGVDGQPVCDVPIKQIGAERVVHRDDQKLKTKALNHKTEKAWRPKSPVLDSVLAADASSFQAAGAERFSEKICGKATDRGGPSQECSTGDGVVLEASTSLQKEKARKWQNMHCLSNSGSSDISSKVEARSLSVAFNDQQSEIVGLAIDQLTECKNERDTLKDTCSSHACNTTCFISQGLTAEAFNFMETDGLSQSKAKVRPSYHKAEKEWRPKSPAVEVIASTDSVFQRQANEANIISLPGSDNNSMESNHESKIVEQEGPQAFDTYDYEGQRARLKEIAAQRAKQRLKEEEERAKEQMAKALAKLEELDRRAMSNSTSIEVNEHATAVLIDEAPNRKTKKRYTSSSQPSTDVSLRGLEKQQIGEASIQDSFELTSPVSPTVDNKEAANNEETISSNFRNKRDGFDKNSLKVLEDHEVHEPVSGTSSSQGQRRISRKDSWMGQEGLPSVQDTGADSCSSEKKDAAESGRPRREKRGSHNQVRQVASNHGNERKSVVHAVEERKELKLSPKVSEFGKVRSKSEKGGRGQSLQSNAEEIRKPKVAELLASEEDSLAFYAPEKNSGLRLSSAHVGHSHESAGESLQKQGGNMETSFTVQQGKTFENKQLTEPIAGSSVDFLSEKVGRLHVSWKQKNLRGHQFQPNSDSGVKTNRQIALEESSNAPTLSRKPRKIRNGGKQSGYGQQGLIELEGCVIDERTTDAPGPMDLGFTELNATFNLKHEAEVNAIEHIKDGVSRNSWWRQKNGKTGGHTTKSNVKSSAHLRNTDEACEEISDSIVPYTLSGSQTSCPHNPRNNVKHSPKAAFGTSQWHRSHSVKPTSDSASSHEQQAGSQVGLEEVSASWHWVRSSVQCGNDEEQEVKIVSANHPRKHGLRPQAEAKLPVGKTHYKHQEMHSMEVATDLPISGKNRLNYSNSETRRTIRQHQTAFQAFSPHDEYHEAESEHHGEQRPFNRGNGVRRPSSRGNKPASQRQFSGCSTAAELDRRDAETAIKTGISY